MTNNYKRLQTTLTFQDIAEILQKPWAPLKSKQLHPIIRDPSAGDSDEYLLPIVLSDIRMN